MRVRSEPSRPERPLDQPRAFGNLTPRPTASGPGPRAGRARPRATCAPRGAIVEQHQREQPRSPPGSGSSSTSRRPSRMASPTGRARVSDRAGGRRVSFVEHEVDDAQHRVEPRRQLGRRRHLIRNARVADLRLRAHDALGEGGRRRQERPRDLLGGETRRLRAASARPARPARSAGWQHVKISRSRSSSTPSSSVRPCRRIIDGNVERGARLVQRIEARAPAHGVDRLEAAGGHEPGAGVGGNAVAWPLLERRPESVVQRFLSRVEVAEQPDERSEHAARVGEIDGVHRFVHVIGRRHRARSHHSWCADRKLGVNGTSGSFRLPPSRGALRRDSP